MFIWKNVVTPQDRQTFERRQHRRLRVTLDVTACRVNQGKFCRLTAADVSAGGMRFLSSVPLAIGEVVDLQVPVDEAGAPINVIGKVTWCRAQPESPIGVYEGGLAFTRISARSHERLTRFIEALTAAEDATSDRTAP